MVRIAYAAALIAAVALVTIARHADAQPRRVQVGTLACSLSSSIGLILGSQLRFLLLGGAGRALYRHNDACRA
jgi:hypothetical protein